MKKKAQISYTLLIIDTFQDMQPGDGYVKTASSTAQHQQQQQQQQQQYNDEPSVIYNPKCVEESCESESWVDQVRGYNPSYQGGGGGGGGGTFIFKVRNPVCL